MSNIERRRERNRRLRPQSNKRFDTEAIMGYISDHNDMALTEICDELHIMDLAELIEELPQEMQHYLLHLLGDSTTGDILDELPDKLRYELIMQVDANQRQRFLSEMASDEVVDFLAGLGGDTAARLIGDMTKDDALEAQELLTFDAHSAAGLMITEFVAFPREMTVAEALDLLPEEAATAELLYYVYVLASGGRLAGVISLRQLVLAAQDQRLGDIATTNLLKVRLGSSQDEVVEILQRYDLLALPVVDNNSVLRGVITYDSIADIINEEATEDVYAFGGVSGNEEESEWAMNAWQRVQRRLPWLVVCIIGGMFGGQIIDYFSEVLLVVVSLAFFMPILNDTAGNVATQSVAIVVRGLATGEVDSKQIIRLAAREAFIGVFIGLSCGAVVAASALLLWREDVLLGLTVGTAMTVTLVVSAYIGAFLPLLSHRLKLDPAVTSGPLATTILDIVGLSIYFFCAKTILGI